MRRSIFLSALVLCGAIAATTMSVPTMADVRVHGLVPGTQHSPSVAMAQLRTYVLSYDRADTTTAVDMVRLALSQNGGEGYQNIPLPGLPSNWYWRPDGHIAYDENTGQLWMVGYARTIGVPGPRVGVYVTNGTVQGNGLISWREPLELFLYQGSSIIVPTLALATGDGTGVAHVLLTQYFDSGVQRPRLYRVAQDAGSATSQDIAVTNPVGRYHTGPTLAAGPNGMVVAGWFTGAAGQFDPPSDIVTRTSHDGGLTFGPEELIGQIGFSADSPGSPTRLSQRMTLLIARHSLDFPATRLAFWPSTHFYGPLLDPSEVFFNSDCCAGTAWNTFGSMLPRLPYSYEVHPAVTMADDGYFYLGWHDFQPFDPDSVSKYMVTRLWNMGAMASEPEPLASATTDWDSVASNFGGMGWQSAAAASAGRVTFAWSDHRGTDPDVYARTFVAGGFELTEGCGDTLEATAGDAVQVEWRIANWNALFADEYSYIVGSNRPWTDGLVPATVVVPANSFADVTYTITVPDSAADAVVTLFPNARDHVRSHSCTKYLRVHALVGVEPGGAAGAVALSAPRPNPSAGATSFTFTLPAPAEVDLAIYDLRGRRVATLARGEQVPGTHAAHWNGTGATGAGAAAAGIYFARLTVRAGGKVQTREQRLVLLR